MAANGPMIIVANSTNSVVVVSEAPDRLVVQESGIQGPPGPAGPPGSNFVWDQTTPSASWIVVHNLNTYPAVTLIIDGEIQYSDVSYIDLNSVSVVFPTPTTGTAVLS